MIKRASRGSEAAKDSANAAEKELKVLRNAAVAAEAEMLHIKVLEALVRRIIARTGRRGARLSPLPAARGGGRESRLWGGRMMPATTACPCGAAFAPAARRSAVHRPRVGGGGTPRARCATIVDARGSASAVDRLHWEDASDEDLRAMVPRAWLEDSATAGAGDWPKRGDEPPPRLVDVSKTPTSETPFRRASRSRLSPADARRFPGDDTFAAVARAVCSADVLPRKELFETWEAALVITEAFGERLRGPSANLSSSSAATDVSTRVADLAGGHGFLALALLVLNPTLRSAVVVDRRKPESHERLVSSLAKAFPKLRLHARVRFVEASVTEAETRDATRVVFAAVHACGDLSDAVLALAVAARAPVALVPCCHRGLGSARRLAKRLDEAMPRGAEAMPGDAAFSINAAYETKTKEETNRNVEKPSVSRESVSPSVAVDVARLETLRRAGYDVAAATLPREITPQNRVILGACAPRDDGEHSVEDEEHDASFDSFDVSGKSRKSSPGWRSVAETLPRSPWKLVGGSKRGGNGSVE